MNMNALRAGSFQDVHQAATAGDVPRLRRWISERGTPVDQRKEVRHLNPCANLNHGRAIRLFIRPALAAIQKQC